MKRISVRFVVALLAFLLGVVTSTIRSSFFIDSPQSAFSSRDEEWHRLYEASRLSGKTEIKDKVHERLLCTNKAGIADAYLLNTQSAQFCRKVDGTMHELLLNDTSEYGSYSTRIISSHSTWIMGNLDFVRTISTASGANKYVTTHERLLFAEAHKYWRAL